MHLEAWRLGLKAVAIYRDNCKVAQPLATAKKGDKGEPDPSTASSTGVPSTGEGMAVDATLAKKVAELEAALERQTVIVKQPVRERLPRQRRSRTFAFRVADCEGYATVGEFDDGRPGELFITVSKQGSTLNGFMDAFAISVSLGLQHGVPVSTYIKKYTNTRFEPAGMTDDPELRIATSLMDYIFRRMALHYLSYEERAELSIFTTNERIQPTLPGVEEASVIDHGVVGADSPHVVDLEAAPLEASAPRLRRRRPRRPSSTAPLCYSCGNEMQRAGSCYVLRQLWQHEWVFVDRVTKRRKPQVQPYMHVPSHFAADDPTVSPNWYPSKEVDVRVVPTWNHEAVHVFGELVVHDDIAWKLNLVRAVGQAMN